MTQEQFDKAIELKSKLNALARAKTEIDNTTTHRLSYIERRKKSFGDTGSDWWLSDVDDLKCIGDILDRHDIQIRNEIDERIEQIYKEIEAI